MSTKHRITFTVVLALLALLVLGTGLVLAEGEAPAAPLIQLDHNPEIRDLRVLSCDNTPTNELPQELEVVRYQGPEIGVVTSTLDLIWSEDEGCNTTQSLGGSSGVQRIVVPNVYWDLGFWGQFTDYYWDIVPGMSWERVVENPALLLQHDVQNDQLRMTGCGLPASSLPSTGDMIQFGQDQEVGLEWNPIDSGAYTGCYTTYGLGGTGSLGISKVTVPSGPWSTNFYDELSGNLWQTDGSTTWSQAPIVVFLDDALGEFVDPDQVGKWRQATVVFSTTVPMDYWGSPTVGGSAVGQTLATTMTLNLGGSSHISMDPGALLSPIEFLCRLNPCPANLGQDGFNLKSVPFGYDFDHVSSAEEGFVYELRISPPEAVWLERSVTPAATLVWGSSSWTMCPTLRILKWGTVNYSPDYWVGSVEQEAKLTLQPGDRTTPFSKLLGPADCVKERIFLPFALR